jgi:hypothetical protein
MKSLLLIFTLIFSTLMFSVPSYAKWEKVGKSARGNTFYADFGRMRKHDGFVYIWYLRDYLKPNPNTGTLSAKIYHQMDCKLFRFKYLSWSFHKEPMGGGTGKVDNVPDKWTYPSPNSVDEYILKSVCSR